MSSPARNLLTISSREANSWAGNFWSRMGWSWPLREIVQSEMNLGAAYVTSENHLVEAPECRYGLNRLPVLAA